MKRKVLIGFVVLVLLASLVSCASFDTNAYKSLAIAQSSYDTGMKAVGDLQKQGKLSSQQIKIIWDAANGYYMAYLTAVSAYQVYHQTKAATDQDKLLTALTACSAQLGALIPIIAQTTSVIINPMPVPTP